MLFHNLSTRLWLENGMFLVQFRHPVIDPRNLDICLHIWPLFEKGTKFKAQFVSFLILQFFPYWRLESDVEFVLLIDFEVLKYVFIIEKGTQFKAQFVYFLILQFFSILKTRISCKICIAHWLWSLKEMCL